MAGHSPEYDHQSVESRRLEVHCPGPRFLFQQVFPDRSFCLPAIAHSARDNPSKILFVLLTFFPGALGPEPSLSPDFDGNLGLPKGSGIF